MTAVQTATCVPNSCRRNNKTTETSCFAASSSDNTELEGSYFRRFAHSSIVDGAESSHTWPGLVPEWPTELHRHEPREVGWRNTKTSFSAHQLNSVSADFTGIIISGHVYTASTFQSCLERQASLEKWFTFVCTPPTHRPNSSNINRFFTAVPQNIANLLRCSNRVQTPSFHACEASYKEARPLDRRQ